MAKLTYLEIVEVLGNKLSGNARQQLDHIIARKKALKEEDTDLDGVLDDLLRQIRKEGK